MFTELKRVLRTKQGKKLIVLMLIPILYASVFTIANWDPYGRVDHLPVALVNADRPALSGGKPMEIGKELVSTLEEDRKLNWAYPTDLSTALTDLEKGKYYMVIYLPPDFSKKATTLMDLDPKNMPIHYYKNGGRNSTGEKMTDGVSTQIDTQISQSITKGYASAMLQSIGTLRQGVSKMAGGASKISGGASNLQEGTKQLNQGLHTLSEKTTLLKDGTKELHNGTEKLKTGMDNLADGVNRLETGSGALKSGIQTYTSGVSSIKDATSQFVAVSSQLRSGVSQYTAGVDSVNAGLARMASGSSKLKTGSQSFYEGLDAYASGVSSLASGADKLSLGMQQLSVKTGALTEGSSKLINIQKGQSNAISNIDVDSQTLYNNLKTLDGLLKNANTEEAKELLNNTIIPQTEKISASLQTVSSGSQALSAKFGELGNSMPILSSGVTTLRDGSQNIAYGSSKLSESSWKLLDGAGQLRDGIGELSDGINKASSGVAQISNNSGRLRSGCTALNEGLVALNSGVETLASNSEELLAGASGIQQGLHTMNGKIPELMNGITKVNDGTKTLADNTKLLNDGVKKLASGSDNLNKGVETLRKGTANLANVLDTSAEHLKAIRNSDKTAEMFSKPTVLEEHALSTVPNGGYGMAPYIMALSLYVGALLTMQVPAIYVPHNRPKSALVWLGDKLPLVLLSSLGQTIFLVGILYLIGLKPLHLPDMVLVALATSLAFMLLILCFLSVLGKGGMTLAMLLLIFQLSGSGGTFPMELMAPFFKTIHPFLPMSYGIDGFREALFLHGQVGFSLSVLLFIVVAAILLIFLAFYLRLSKNPAPAIPYHNDLVAEK